MSLASESSSKDKLMTKAKNHLCTWPLMLFVLAFTMNCVASNSAMLSGSYHIASAKDAGPHVKVRMNLQLTNHGSAAIAIRRLTIWNLSRPSATNACALAVKAHGSVSTEQEFDLTRSEYAAWQHGLRPRMVIELAGDPSHGQSGKTVLRLSSAGRREVRQ